MTAEAYSARRIGDRLLLDVVDAAFADATRRAGVWSACRVGCTECCHAPFPINALDAWRMREGLRVLDSVDPNRAEGIRARAAQAVEQLTPGFPGDATTGVLGDDERAEEAFCEQHAKLVCPALDQATGACDLYASRPVSCRTFGPPVRFGEQDMPPCRLWFVGATRDALEAARVEPDPEDQERNLLEAVNAEGETGDTFVAFAVVRPAKASPDRQG